MNMQEFKKLAIESSEKYYDYLDTNHKGLVIAKVLSKKVINDTIALKVSKKIFSLDCLFLELQGQKLNKNKIRFLQYDESQRMLIIKAVPHLQNQILNLDNQYIEVISDLKFLVKNVRDWYAELGDSIRLPRNIPTLNNLQISSKASPEQREAINAIAKYPFTYIWGAPGTGKTQFVLSEAVKEYIKENKKIIITAPTNNAIEQVLRGVIKALDDNGISRNTVLRLGMPSSAFQAEFPEVCENHKAEQLIKSKQQKNDQVEEVIQFKESEQKLNTLNGEILPLLGKLVGFHYGHRNISAAQIEKLKSYLNDIPELGSVITAVNPQNLYDVFKKVQKFRSDFSSSVEEKRWLYSQFENTSIAELKASISIQSLEDNEFISESTRSRISKVNVIACTIDAVIAKLVFDKNDKGVDRGKYFTSPAHIFMDEAGYANVIKAMTLLGAGCPITLLGDHMQLPPVCEADDAEIFRGVQRSLVLWSQSSIYMGDIFNKSFAEIQSDYFNHAEPNFVLLKKFDLTYSYRFGDRLAYILNQLVYKNGFQSALGNSKFKIRVLNCLPQYSEKKRENYSEAKKIVELVKSADLGDFAILSPYVNQVKLLGKMLPQLYNDSRVLTVHASQGREWDTVILSVSDSNNKWFTDTLSGHTGGKYVINTAASRAKKNLILACDVEHWSQQYGQMISEFVKCADNFSEFL